MNLKKIFIFTLLIWTLVSCSNNTTENNSNISTNNPQVVVEKQIKSNLKTVSVDIFKTELEKNDWILIDLRTTPELAQWVIFWAKQIDYYASDFKEKLNSLDKTKKYLIYCRSWSRTWSALNIMKSLWFTNVIDLDWWIISWARAWNEFWAFIE